MLQEAIKYNIENQSKIREICSPLENSFNISLIHYRRFYFNGGLVSLFNHAKWMEVSFENQYWYSSVLQEKLRGLASESSLTYLWPTKPINDAVYKGLYEHNLWNGITLYRKLQDCIESYAFATSRDNTNAIAFYLSEMEVLEHFILYFRSKMFPGLLGSVEKNILIPCSFQLPSAGESDKNKVQFFQNTPINNFYIRVEGVDIKLTKREEECLNLLALGMKVKEIAHVLQLSARTVESYIEQARLKTNCNTTSQLLSLHNKSRLYDRITHPYVTKNCTKFLDKQDCLISTPTWPEKTLEDSTGN